MATTDDVGWNIPGWDWPEGDYSWLSSESGLYSEGTSIFFIHGGRIRHQAHIPYGWHTADEFDALIRERCEGLDDPKVVWLDDTGGGDAGLWVEGTRVPNDDDLTRLQEARDRKTHEDRNSLRMVKQRHPEWGIEGGPWYDPQTGWHDPDRSSSGEDAG